MKRAWFHRSYRHWLFYQALSAPYIFLLLILAAVYDEDDVREAVEFWRFTWTRTGYSASLCCAAEARSAAYQ